MEIPRAVHLVKNICSIFSWDLQWSQEKIKTMLMQNFGGQTRSIMVFLTLVYEVRERVFQCFSRDPAWSRTCFSVDDGILLWYRSATQAKVTVQVLSVTAFLLPPLLLLRPLKRTMRSLRVFAATYKWSYSTLAQRPRTRRRYPIVDTPRGIIMQLKTFYWLSHYGIINDYSTRACWIWDDR